MKNKLCVLGMIGVGVAQMVFDKDATVMGLDLLFS